MSRRLIIACHIISLLCPGVVSGNQIRLDTSIWQITHGRLGSGQQDTLTLSGLNHHIYVVDKQGVVLLKRDVGGIPFQVLTEDIDGNIGAEIMAAVLDGEGNLKAFDAKLKPLWQYSDDQTFLSIGVGDINHDGQKEIVAGSLSGRIYVLNRNGGLLWKKGLSKESSIGALAVGDIGHAPGDEIVVGTRNNGIYILDGGGSVLKHISTKLPGSAKKRHYELLWIREIRIDDIDHDGKNEFVVGSRPSGMITVFNGEGKVIWRKEFDNIVNRWSNAQIGIGNLTGDNKMEIICLLQGIVVGSRKNTTPIVMLNYKGEIISKFFPQVGYMDVVPVPGNNRYDDIVVASSARSPTFWITTAEKLPSVLSDVSLSRTDRVTDKLLSELTNIYPSRLAPQTGSKRMHIIHHVSFSQGIEEIEQLYRFLQSRESKNLVFEIMVDGLREKESKARKHKVPKRFRREKAHPQDTILEFAANMERKRIPYYIRLAKNNKFHLSIETVEKILSISPNFCKGFIVNECSYTRRKFRRFVDLLEKVLQILAKYGERKLILNQHFDFWFKIPADPMVARKLFRPAFRNVMVPMYKTNRPHAPELNLGMIVGMWKGGLVEEWGFCAQDDLWKFESVFMNPPDDVILRMEVMAASLGATYFRIEGNREFLRKKGNSYELEAGSKRHRDLFHSLVRKGVVVPLIRSDQLLVSPVVFSKKFNPQSMPRPDDSHASYWVRAFQSRGILSYDFALKRARDDYLPGLWTHIQHYYNGLFPGTPYGFVCFLPSWFSPEKTSWAELFSTDEVTVSDAKGNRIKDSQLNAVIVHALKEQAMKLPFSADNIFLSINKFDDGTYLLYLMDTKQFNVHDTNIKLRINLGKRKARVVDAFDNKVLGFGDTDIPLTVPAGLFRILQVEALG